MIVKLIEEELQRANEKNSPFQTPHEAYGVIKEELEESEENLCDMKKQFDLMWQCVRIDSEVTEHVVKMRTYAIFAIQELIQVAAMCDKALNLYAKQDKEE